MKIRSTGLGKTELECKIDKLEPVGDYLVLAIDTVAPVKWKVRAALSYRDLWGMVLTQIITAFQSVSHQDNAPTAQLKSEYLPAGEGGGMS